ncbi:uncharacterized protein LOC115735099 [Rhodamnia argentea]|uniref:Uncharacterized protein LOC115735099 n=1 Tax=Rhodamnia argentea TaxID=178133 RepID=A0A8B8NIY6_9MYRT|nr:uncharacterized protein LOC115735099 [Rhodamnia argentea]
MAASRMISRATATHKNPPSSHHHHHQDAPDDAVFEFDEPDLLWSDDDGASSDPRRPQPRSLKKLQRRPSEAEAPSPAGASLPVNIPDWSKILQGEYGEHHRGREAAEDGGSDGDEGDEDGDRVPPHEFLARRRGASLSVHEGVGRTLKGRDLRRVRNAIWKKVGFED